ncbi:MAG: hypothetical protein PHV28_05140 [Kiritimatiellae bacterium]|nr:hypothetical protein [Kiritimatiellia bacterium]
MCRELSYPPQLLRDLLVDYARSRFYSPESDELWTRLKELFAAMRDGGAFGGHTITQFNGGLFAHDPELDALRIPARLFCAPNQGATQDPASLLSDKRTLLYFSARYNFGKHNNSLQRTIGLTTLGRIFEQSITELEIMEAEADGRVSLNKLGKRKTDGVYYTPEWVTHAIVAEVVGGRLSDIRAELGFADLPPLTSEAIAAYRAFRSSRGRRTAPIAGEWLAFLKTYRLRVDGLRVVDPACGSGAFLIQALDRLIAEYRWIVDQEERITGVRELWNQDALIRSILSGIEAKRYQRPATNTWILFPYTDDGRLLAESELSGRFPNAWRYLQSHEAALRGRERGAFDDPSWYRFGRNQNIDKQHLPKLLVPRLVTHLFAALDEEGACCLDNVDVGGILAADRSTLLYLYGILNAPVCDYVWRRISKPFQNDFRSANKQFIAPLPIPDATPAQRGEVGRLALRLQDLHTRDRELANDIDARLASAQTEPFEPGPEWLWADVRTPAQWKGYAPANVRGAARTAWAKDRRDAVLAGHLAALDAALAAETPAVCEVAEDAGRLTLRVNSRVAVELFDKPDAPFIAAQWRHALRSFHGNAKRLLALLLKLRATPDAALAAAVTRLVSERQTLAAELAATEGEMNALVLGLYGLTVTQQTRILGG